MSVVDEDYSDYIQHLSNMGSMYTFLSGFMFNAITVVLTQLRDPSVFVAQVVLFFMASLFDVFILFMGDFDQKVLSLQTCTTVFGEAKFQECSERVWSFLRWLNWSCGC